MLWIIVLVIAAGVIYYFVSKNSDSTDAAFDTSKVVAEIKAEAKSVLDVNKDGKVDVADAVEAGKKVKAGAKKAAGKAKDAAKKVKAKVAKK